MLVSVNQGLATLSGDFLMAALLIYSLAVVAFAGDFAFGRPRRAAASRVAAKRVAQLATVGAGPAAEDTISTSVDSMPAAPVSAWQAISEAGTWVRAALGLSTL